MEVGINYLLPAVEVKEPGQVVVPAARLAAVVRESTDETLMLKANEGLCEVRGRTAISRFMVRSHRNIRRCRYSRASRT